MNKEQKDISSLILNRRFQQKDTYNSISMPIYGGVAFEFDNAEEMEDAFLGKNGKYTYSRISNPTVEVFEDRVQQISEAKHVLAASSGMAAILDIFMTIAYAGSNIVTSPHLFGNTFSLFNSTLKVFEVETRFCNLLDEQEITRNIDDKTCAIFVEAITNPHLEVADLQLLSFLAHSKNVPLIADSTLVPWPAFNAKKLGVDLEIVSSTKYISGGATSIGGLIMDHQTFDWSNSPRLKELSKTVGEQAFTIKLRNEISRNTGTYMSPYVAFLQSLGLETLSLRFKKASENCLSLAKFLQTIPQIKEVNCIGLPDNPSYKMGNKQFGEYSGAMLTFNLKDRPTCFSFLNRLQVIRRATNLFDNKSLIIHPLSTIYSTLNDKCKKMIEVPNEMLRLSVGLENIEDLKEDILQALNNEKKNRTRLLSL
ncbi:PLP-dependent transferase [Candidatus Azobacteroides pseudotrichonymphae]|uniref:O-acetylhomoserine (Thiol)-lyase/cysteine synthase n=1 Tax=Azobacteroides pseudotrichonymphae genomovar. CFP2 TaxID=511995 RepID=B6YS20_AZOPC|nr:PLP-dependent transferase [Candidatus Azobacteroides pseudotrichonymphae]BAG83992.1 O-acetylhomoserine (thiol)-lyase/cysteine synthase [Candidatus Azobacteroides pseudotrichonymphae genomovar. CFP2]